MDRSNEAMRWTPKLAEATEIRLGEVDAVDLVDFEGVEQQRRIDGDRGAEREVNASQRR